MSSFDLKQYVPRKPICKLLSERQRRIRIRQMLAITKQHGVPLPSSPSTSSNQQINTTVNLQDVPSSSAEYADGIDAIHHNVDLNDHSSSSSSCSSSLVSRPEVVPETAFQERLASFCVENNITHTQGNNLLSLLRTHGCFNHLPKDIRTVLGTPRTRVPTHVVEPGEYIHSDVETQIIKYLNNASFCPDGEIELDFSTDGCALDKSGTIHLWPIQCMIRNIPDARPIVVGIYKGSTKPRDPNRFFNMFFMNIKHIISNGGIDFHDTKVPMKLRCFIADAPARSFLLNHHGHTSSRACSKCKVSGVQSNRRYIFNGINHPLRTDREYSQCVDEDHHKEGSSPLSSLPFGMVSQVPFEYMHLVCLGVVKKVLSAWVCGKYSRSSKLPATHISCISERLNSLKEFCPSEFGRRPRSLVYYSKLKAVEFRQFLLYTGPGVVYGLLNGNVGTHFLFLHTAIRILASQSPSPQYLKFAEVALQTFVLRTEEVYGPNFSTYNVHGRLHLTNDVRRLGPLDSFSAFPYENNMRIFRKFCRKPGLPLQQLSNRMAAIDSHGTNSTRVVGSSNIKVSMPLGSDTDMSSSIDGAICILCSISKHENTFQIGVRRYSKVEDIYDIGVKSALGLYKCSLLGPLFYITPTNIRKKCYRMPFGDADQDDNEEEGQERREYCVAEMLHSDTYYN